MAEEKETEEKEAEPRARYDLFRDVRPYYGTVVAFERRDNVPTLFTICVRFVIDEKVNFQDVPTVLNSRLTEYKKYEEYNGPKIMKCSVCAKFYSKRQKFLDHSCED